MGLTERKRLMENEYVILSARLTPDEMVCLAHCRIFDCAADGECELQERAADIIAAESEVMK